MAHGPKPAPVTLSSEERAALQALVRRRSAGPALVQRARIVLACAEPNSTNAGVARALGVSRPSVTTWRARFAAHRLDGLVDAPHPGGAAPGWRRADRAPDRAHARDAAGGCHPRVD